MNKNKRKFIEMHSPDLIVCDNQSCDFKVPSKTGDPNEDISMYLNVGCPKCGENLLTERDHNNHLKLMKVINWLNKWFSWTKYFSSPIPEPEVTVWVHSHKGINVEIDKIEEAKK